MSKLNRVSLMVVLSSLSLLLAVVAQVIVAYTSPFSVVSFDKDKLLKQFVTQLSHKPQNLQKTDELSARFAKALRQSLNEYAQKNKTVIVKKELVLASRQDISNLIAKSVAIKMRNKT